MAFTSPLVAVLSLTGRQHVLFITVTLQLLNEVHPASLLHRLGVLAATIDKVYSNALHQREGSFTHSYKYRSQQSRIAPMAVDEQSASLPQDAW